ncbi:MAG: ZIP family metal transporter [Bacteroidota bacterium]
MIYLALILAVLIGFLFAHLLSPKTKVIQLFLSFSGAYLLSITVLHLIPEVFETKQKNIGIFILIGIVLQTVLEYLSKGAEHGHIHSHGNENHIPWLLLFSLNIHAFLEGMPLGLENNFNLLWAIIVHKIPVTIILAVFLRNSKLSRSSIYSIIVVFALMSPLGSYFARNFSYLYQYETQINAIIIGVFLHISTAILFESSENHQFNLKKFASILIGFGIAFLSVV